MRIIKKFFRTLVRFIVLILVLLGVVIGVYRGVTRGFFSNEVHPIFDGGDVDLVVEAGAPNEGGYFFDNESAGPLVVGMLISEMRKHIGPWWVDVILTREEGRLFEEYVVYDKDSEQLLRVTPVCAEDEACRVSKVEIVSSRFKTASGLGIGDTYAEIKEMNIATSIHYDGVNLFVTTTSGLKFIFNGSYLSKTKENYDVKDLSESATIESILLSVGD